MSDNQVPGAPQIDNVVEAAPPEKTMGGLQWAMLAMGALASMVGLLFCPICMGPIGIGLGAGVILTGGPKGKKFGIGLIIFAVLCTAFGMVLGAALAVIFNKR